MLMSSRKFSGLAPPGLTLLTGLVVGFASGCARPTTTSEAEPEAAPQDEPTNRSTVTAEEIERTPNEGIPRTLVGRVSGVTVTETANGLTIRIRGATSLHGSTEPLFVIDGIPIQTVPGGALFGISIHDIESIEVLKDAASMTQYGVRGANGIIVIKTKPPNQ
jgi:TonB-dependent SusC/RagA subfamily outer membrane receptor